MVNSQPAERVALVAGDGHPQLARAVADALGIVPMPLVVSAFADGESRIRLEGEVLNADVYILQVTSTPTNERLMTLALTADAARGAGARR
ncbi:MAG: ribose-phosphate pyrophosphokinase-like domain-containing protein, partial [Burkholderiales bacterium]